MNGQPLALAGEAFAEQEGWRRREELVDSLPYIDGLEAGEKEAVMRLVEEEVSATFLLFRVLIHSTEQLMTKVLYSSTILSRQEIAIRSRLII